MLKSDSDRQKSDLHATRGASISHKGKLGIILRFLELYIRKSLPYTDSYIVYSYIRCP